MHARAQALSALVFSAAIAAAMPAVAVQRAFVASFGSDANAATNCGFANPCRSFTTALGVADSGGEVVALDAAGYGPVTVTKSITITANPGFYAGITSALGSAVTIATPGVDVILRGLNINGLGSGLNGVEMTDGSSLTIENCVIANFSDDGVLILGPRSVRISDSILRGNAITGIRARAGATLDVFRSSFQANAVAGVDIAGDVAGVTTSGTISNSVATGNAVGFESVSSNETGIAHLAVSRSTASENSDVGLRAFAFVGTAVLTVSGSLVSGNGIGLQNLLGVFESRGDNTVRQNATDTFGPITLVPGT